MINGIININKEKDFTSHDVVAKLRGILKQKKIGHTGTLDPNARGVLPVCLGKATKLCDLLTDKDKTYKAVLLLGIETDTQDTTGKIISEIDSEKIIKDTDLDQLKKVIYSFIGEYDQIPPMYSALKVNGQKLYDLARAGIEVERKARRVNIRSITINKIELPRVEFTVQCSKGTYIRTLCSDIGNILGYGGCMEELLRTKVERFNIENALTLSQVENLLSNGQLEDYILPIDEMFQDYPKAYIKEDYQKLLYNGNELEKEYFEFSQGNFNNHIRVYDMEKKFIALYKYSEADEKYKNHKMFF